MTSQSQQLGRGEPFYLESVRDEFVAVHNEMDRSCCCGCDRVW